MVDPDILLPEPRPIQPKDEVEPEICIYTSPLPEEAVVSGTENEYERPFWLAETVCAYAEEAADNVRQESGYC